MSNLLSVVHFRLVIEVYFHSGERWTTRRNRPSWTRRKQGQFDGDVFAHFFF